MFQSRLTSLSDTADAVTGTLLSPGHYLWSVATSFKPDLLQTLGASEESVVLGVALAYWLIVLIVGIRLFFLVRSFSRSAVAIVHALVYRLSHGIAGIKTRLRLKFRGLVRWRGLLRPTEPPVVEFDDLELAVLRYGAARGPGFAISAPEIAEKFSVRPSQVQRCLDKLNQNRMLDHAIGSTDGFDNYRLTESGSAFLAMWQRQASAA